MTWRELAARIGGLLRLRRDSSVDDEVRFHLEMSEEAFRRQGLDREAAHRAAVQALGGMSRVGEAYNDQQSLPFFERLAQDARYGLRTLRRSPGFAAAALLTTALGIGANVAIFSIVHTVLLRDLPFASPDRLITWSETTDGETFGTIGYATITDIRDRSQALEGVAAFASWNPTLIVDGRAERLNAMRVTWNFFQLLGASPALGRPFQTSDDTPANRRVLLLSDRLWRRSFNADPSIVGRTITMNDVAYQVAGVMPPSFEPLISGRFYQPAEVWSPLGYDATVSQACRTCRHVRVMGKMKPGVTIDQARAELDALMVQMRAANPTSYATDRMSVLSLSDAISGPVRPILLVLLGAVGLVLLIACANVGNLLLARAMNRSHEMAVRAALGATRGRLVRQMLTESLLLSFTGGALGIGAAGLALKGVEQVVPAAVPRLASVGLNIPVLVFAVVLSVATGIVFGLIPALRVSSSRLRGSLASDSRTLAPSSVSRQILVAVDVALALMLLVGAGLMLRSVVHLVRSNPGFESSHVLTAQFSLVGQRYREDAAVIVFHQQLLESVRAVPGVESAALAGQIPMGGNRDSWGFHVEGRLESNPEQAPSVERYSITPDYLKLMRIPIVRGRGVIEADTSTSEPVMLVSESTARALWPGADPIGARVRVGANEGVWRRVVGVVGNVRHADLAEETRLQMYLPQTQFTDSFLVLTVRSSLPPDRVADAIRSSVQALDPKIPLYQIAPLDTLVAQSFADRMFVLQVLGVFAIAGVVLAAIGLYGVITYTVAQRTRELALRLALGADRGDVLRVVFGAGARSVTAGLAIGAAGALATTRMLDSLLFGVSPIDPVSLAAGIAVLLTVTAAAHAVPALRALRVNPAIALRSE
jgi:putative ABC transport system permease protein